MIDLSDTLTKFPAQILQHIYDYEAFGSWWLTIKYKGKRYRILFNGKEGRLVIELAEVDEWKEIASQKSRQYTVDEITLLFREAIERA
jgi:hypothetical protein